MLSGGFFASKWRNFKILSILEDSVLTEDNLITVNGPEWKAFWRLLTEGIINPI